MDIWKVPKYTSAINIQPSDINPYELTRIMSYIPVTISLLSEISKYDLVTMTYNQKQQVSG